MRRRQVHLAPWIPRDTAKARDTRARDVKPRDRSDEHRIDKHPASRAIASATGGIAGWRDGKSECADYREDGQRCAAGAGISGAFDRGWRQAIAAIINAGWGWFSGGKPTCNWSGHGG